VLIRNILVVLETVW